MLTMNQQTVNVDRIDMLDALKKGRRLHEAALVEATDDYYHAARQFLADASARANAGDFTNIHFKLTPPQSNLQKYDDVIEMYSVSVDATIKLDMDTYKAYYKNEWPWSRGFLETAIAAKAATGALR